MNAYWYDSPRLKKLGLFVLGLILITQGFVAIFYRDNDFAVHRDQGYGFLQGQPYAHGLETYPVARMMLNGLFALMSNYQARTASYLLAVLALYATFRMWSKLAEGTGPASASVNQAAGVLGALMFLPYLLRDLDECGLQIFLLFFLTAAAHALVRQRHIQTGFWIATAIQYKVAPLLFVPFLIWKRQWRATAYVAVFVGIWAVVPALFIGWDATVDGHKTWFERVVKVNSARDAYPSLQEMEPPKPQNLSLLAALARYVETYPENHPLHLTHPWFRQFGNLDSESAYMVVRGIIVALGLFLAWRWRHAWQGPSLTSNLPGEWSSVTMLASLLAPQCWKQHLIVVFPAAFMVLRQQLAAASAFRWRLGVLVLISAVAMLGRQQVLGRELSVVFLSYKLDTFAALLLMFLTMTLPRSQKSSLGVVLPLRRAA